ncbi:putative quinol monooxygenase [Cupriavidus pauculus]|uniref:putative quinol monooxygenase n=1 Tax=Cupriavidus pauculus TaxID=82633 RepID=UPI001EE343EE|nr:putative quinol monooxygenase [Cupriavidus pauculus]GJG97693.1 antibiotic biosynthesis monooxygenase [Cupriavidus pauculus]
MSNCSTHLQCVVLVELAIEPTRVDEFLPLMLENASSSLALEPGCHVFDVCRAPDDPTRFILYEVYEDEAAFRQHLETIHFLAFNQQTEAYTISKSIRIFERIEPMGDQAVFVARRCARLTR